MYNKKRGTEEGVKAVLVKTNHYMASCASDIDDGDDDYGTASI